MSGVAGVASCSRFLFVRSLALKEPRAAITPLGRLLQ
jgi:hypothetical protein